MPCLHKDRVKGDSPKPNGFWGNSKTMVAVCNAWKMDLEMDLDILS